MINWPDSEEDDILEEGKDIVEQLLCHNPYERLGSSVTGGQYNIICVPLVHCTYMYIVCIPLMY